MARLLVPWPSLVTSAHASMAWINTLSTSFIFRSAIFRNAAPSFWHFSCQWLAPRSRSSQAASSSAMRFCWVKIKSSSNFICFFNVVMRSTTHSESFSVESPTSIRSSTSASLSVSISLIIHNPRLVSFQLSNCPTFCSYQKSLDGDARSALSCFSSFAMRAL